MIGFFEGTIKGTFEQKPRQEFTPPLIPKFYPPVFRPFRRATICNQQILQCAHKDKIIQVMSYNLLADGLAVNREVGGH